MTIAYDAKRLFQNFTGLGNYSRTLLRNLALYFPENTYQLFAPKIVPHPSTQFFINHKAPFELHTAPHPFHALWRTFDIKKDAQKHGAQLFHGLSHELPIGIKQAKLASVVTMHDLVFKVYPEYTPAFQRQIYDYKFRYACENADHIIAISEQTKADIVHYYNIAPENITVIYQTCADAFQDWQIPLPPMQLPQLPASYMLYVGSVIERKNLLRIIQAMAILPKDTLLPLVVVGNGGDYMLQVKQAIQQYKLSDKVIFIEKMIYEALPSLYRGASLFLYPSEYEGFGIPIIEALFSKIPVISSNVSCLPEAAGPSSLLIDPTSVEAIANAIEIGLSDTALRQKMIKDGYQYAVDNFAAKKVTQEVNDLYLKIHA